MDRRIRTAVLLAGLATAVVWRTGAFLRPIPVSGLQAEDAQVWSLLESLDQARTRGVHPLSAHPDLVLGDWVPQYVARWFAQQDGVWQPMIDPDLTSPWCVYLCPRSDDLHPVFCLSSEGPLLVCTHHRYAPASEPSPRSAMTPESGRFRTSAGTGTDGNRWAPSRDFDLTTLHFNLHGPDGNALPEARLRVLSREEGAEQNWRGPKLESFRFDGPVPLGTVFFDDSDTAELRGPALESGGLGFVMSGNQSPCAKEWVRVDGDHLEVTIPDTVLTSYRICRNESHAIATLKRVASAQSQLQASDAIDVDGDRVGEYGFFGELAGTADLRGTAGSPQDAHRLAPAVLDAKLGVVLRGCVAYEGYLFRIFLPDARGLALGEAADGGAADARVDPFRAARHWVAYAWPIEQGRTGDRTFAISECGDVISTQNDIGYSGYDHMPGFTAALRSGGQGTFDDLIAANTVGCDGATWVIIQ